MENDKDSVQVKRKPLYPHLVSTLLIVMFMGAAWERNGIWHDPVLLWEDTARKSPKIGRVFNNLGEAYHRKRQLAKALENYSLAIRLSPASSVDAYSNIGSIYVDLGEYGKAVLVFSQLLMLDQNDAITYASRGHAYYRQGLYDNAIRDFDRSLQLSPRNPTVLFYRGTSYEKKGNRSAAFQDFKAACALGETNACSKLSSN